MPSLALTPRGHLLFNLADDAVGLTIGHARTLESAFGNAEAQGS